MTHEHAECGQKSKFTCSILLILASMTFALLLSELVFRYLLFNGGSFMGPLRRAEFYANEWDLDFFKLRHFFGHKYIPPTDENLGWRNDRIDYVDGDYAHIDDKNLRGRTPVLLFGDSFAQCHTTEEECFQGILNKHPDFNKSYYLINYGVSGYGVDQVLLLYRSTIMRYRNPIVIIGIMNYDLDRNIMPVTWGLKPYFEASNGKLRLKNSHLFSYVDIFFRDNPPKINSYLWRLLVHEGPLPENIRLWMKSLEEDKQNIKEVSTPIIGSLADELKFNNIRHIFVLFEWPKRMVKAPDWRVNYLVDVFHKKKIDYIMARGAIINNQQSAQFNWSDYSVDDGHPNYFYNQLVSQQILSWVLELDQ